MKISLEESGNPEYYQLVSDHNNLMDTWNTLNNMALRFRVPKIFLFRAKSKLKNQIGEPTSRLQKEFLNWNKKAGTFCLLPHYKFDTNENGELNFTHFTSNLRDMINSMEVKMTLITENHNKRYSEIENQRNFVIAIVSFIIAITSFVMSLPLIKSYVKTIWRFFLMFDLGSMFDMSFWQGLITTFIAASLAIPAALWIDRRLKSKKAQEERRQLNNALKEAIDKNMTLLAQLEKDYLGQGRVPFFPMDLVQLNSTSYRKYEILDSISLCQAIDQAIYELQHFDGKLELLRTKGDTNLAKNLSPFYQEVYQSCQVHVPKVRESLEKAKALLET